MGVHFNSAYHSVGELVPLGQPSQYIRVSRLAVYVAKKTSAKYRKGKRVSKEYAKRYPHLIKRIQYLQVEERPVKFDAIAKKQTYGDWKVTARQKLNYYEQIIDLKKMSDRRVATVFAREKVYKKIWDNERGSIRITVNGRVGDRRVKQVLHLGYIRSMWENKHNGYAQFKDYLLSKVLETLRKRGLRLSNPKESLERVRDLQRKVISETKNLSSQPDWVIDSKLKSIKAMNRLIVQQKKSAQLLGGTIRIEKLVP